MSAEPSGVPRPAEPPPGGSVPERDRLALARVRFDLAPGASPLAGDAGARRYFRVATAGGARAVLVLYPETGSAAQASWLSIAGALERAGVRVPACHADDPELGAALIEDLGDRDLGDELRESAPPARARLLDEAEELLGGVRTIEKAAVTRNPPFDAAFFTRELGTTRHFALERGGAEPLAGDRAAVWEVLAAELAESAASCGGPVATHRDFHANNLMRAPDGRLAVIDFQDLRLGPPDYDPVSLRWERAGAAETLSRKAPPRCEEAVLLQRAWKVFGTFEKMLLLGREVYRPHRDTTLAVIRAATPAGSRFAPLLGLIRTR
jgi:aminoglycoside/choline kinase family phosphotransferase